MTEQDIIDYIHTSICDCHLADEYVELAQKIKPHISRELPEFETFYKFLLNRIRCVTPIEDDHDIYLNKAIETYWKV